MLGLLQLGLGLLCGLLLLLLLLWAWIQVTQRDLIKAASSIPSLPNSLPFLGHMHYTVFGLEGSTNRFLEWIYNTVCDNKIYTFCFWCGPLPLIFVNSAEDIQKVLNNSNTLEKSDEYRFLKFAAKDGLLTAPVNIWRQTRRHLNPMFHPRNLEQLIPVFNRNSCELVTRLAEHVDCEPVDLFNPAMDAALQTVCNLIYGAEIKINRESKEFLDLKNAVQRVPELTIERIVKPWLRPESWFNFLYAKELNHMDKVFKVFTQHYKGLKDKQEISLDSTATTSSQTKQQSKLDIGNLFHFYRVLQENLPTFTDEELHSEIVTLYAAGTDTVGLTLSSCLLALAYHQDIQDRLYKEISSIIGGLDDVTITDINQMTYLDQVYKETLRWALIVPFIGRQTTTDLQLSSCKIPAGSTIVLSLLGIQWNSKVYSDPKRFDPERFVQNHTENTEKYKFLPFSGGPRSCIGKLYADLLVKVQVIHVLKNFKLTTEMDIYNLKKKFAITLVCTEGYNMRIHKRDAVKCHLSGSQ